MAAGSAHVRSFPEAIAFAARGLRHAARTQRHFRAQLLIAAGALLFAAGAGVPRVELAVLTVTVAFVLGAELLNTAIEMLTDLLHPDRGPAAAAVKDVSAAAVLVAVGLALAVGLLVLLPHVIEPSPTTARAIPLVLGALCLIILVAGAVRSRGPSRV